MITSIRIVNYALIRDLELLPSSGFNIITGETGSGKSIIMGALSLLQGRRAESRAYLQEERSMVEAVFEIPASLIESVNAVLRDNSIPELTGTTLSLKREIRPNGRSKASVNGVQVQLGVLAALSALLIDIHTQHNNLLLAEPAFQLEVLDNLADNSQILTEYHEIYAQYRVALREFADKRDEIACTTADADYLEYQLNDFASVELAPGMEEELESQRATLANATAIGEKLAEAAHALGWGEPSASQLIATAEAALTAASELSDDYLAPAQRLAALRVELDDIADSVAERASVMRDDPAALDEIEKTLDKISSLKSKHKADSVEALIAARDSIAARLRDLADSEAILKELEAKARRLKRLALEKANLLSQRRRDAAAALESDLTDRARPLGMANLKVEIHITSGKLNPDGIDTVDFLFSFNKNQQPAPIASHASGGEIARLMLALKSLTATHRHLPTIIFDEIDTGVSGEVARKMGLLMAEIARHMQVMTITHLPQVAARGERHFKVYKTDEADATCTHISLLEGDARTAELALMIGGDSADPSAIAAAKSLIDN